MEDLNRQPYVPTSEEEQKARETMTGRQVDLSDIRYNNSEKMGQPYLFESQEFEGGRKLFGTMVGKDKKHSVEFFLVKGEGDSVRLKLGKATLDGMEVDQNTANKLYKKLNDPFMLDSEWIDYAHEEVIEEGKKIELEEAIDDLLG